LKGANIGYIRVSTFEQNTERQLAGVELDKIFDDSASGKSTNRPQLAACLDYLREGDTLFVHSIDRLARNLADLQRIVRDLTQKGVVIKFLKENLVFSAGENNPLQNLMLQMLGAFAEFERALIRERQREGIEIARQKGKPLGRAKTLSQKQIKELKAEAANGEAVASLAKKFGVSRQTVYRMLF
jgi:DNA invertase Pin-like site-specific DNA recombinase